MAGASGGDRPVRETYVHSQDRTLSEAVVAAIERYEALDSTDTEFVLYEKIDPDALDFLYDPSASADVVVEFDVGDLRVTLRGGDAVEISVTGRRDLRDTE